MATPLTGTTECSQCLSTIPAAAKRCSHCGAPTNSQHSTVGYLILAGAIILFAAFVVAYFLV